MSEPAGPADVAGALSDVLASIDAGELEATDVQRAYIADARDALATICERTGP